MRGRVERVDVCGQAALRPRNSEAAVSSQQVVRCHQFSATLWVVGATGVLTVSALAMMRGLGYALTVPFVEPASAFAFAGRRLVTQTTVPTVELLPQMQQLRGAAAERHQHNAAFSSEMSSAHTSCAVAAIAVLAFAVQDRAACAVGAGRRPLRRRGIVPCSAEGGESTIDESEKIFREAFEAEYERTKLLKDQVETALTEKMGSSSRITIEDGGPMSPEVAGGKPTWREAYQAAKQRTSDLEEQLKKARGIGAAPPPPSPAAAPASPSPASPAAATGGTSTPQNPQDPGLGFLQGAGGDTDDFRKLENLAANVIEEESARLIAVPILGRRLPQDQDTPLASLPTFSKVTSILGSDQFSVAESWEFERVYVLKGNIATGTTPAAAIEQMQQRFENNGLSEECELLLQNCKEEGKQVLFVMLKEDLLKNEFQPWQWFLCIALCIATVFSVNVTTFSVAAIGTVMAPPQPGDTEAILKLANLTIPTAGAILATIAGMEAARRAAAGAYKVELTPPFLMPVWPIPSIGSLGAISRRLTLAQNKEAELAMSTAAGLAGFVVSIGIILVGLAQGPSPDGITNLNFQMLPAALKLILKPFLGKSSVSEQPDPFLDPINIAYPANPLLIGGVIGLIIVSLNLLPIGRLDGGTIIKKFIGNKNGSIAGFLGLGLLLLGTLNPGSVGDLYLTFGSYCLLFQNGPESPPRDSITEADSALKNFSAFLVLLACILSVPGAVLPNL